MSLLIYLNGTLVPESEAKVSVFDHGLLYGDGVFEGIRGYHGKIFRLDEHLKRLYDSAKAIMLEIPMEQTEMKKAVLDTVRANKLKECYIRIVVTRGYGDLGLDPRKCKIPTLIIIASKIQLYPESLYEEGLRIFTVPTRRNPAESLNPAIKSLNYLNNILAKMETINYGAIEALILNQEGYIAECTGDNIFILKENKLMTPPISAGALDGITRDAVIGIAERLHLPFSEPQLMRYNVFTADECFLTGTAAEIIPVTYLDGRKIGTGKPGPMTAKIREEYETLTKNEGTPVY